MDQKIDDLTAPDQLQLDQQFEHAADLVRTITGKPLNGSLNDLLGLQRVLESKTVEPEAEYTLESLGVAFGRVFVAENPDYQWCMVEDEYGRDPGVRYKQTTLLAFPSQMILRRIEEREPFTVPALYVEMSSQLDEIRQEHYAGD